MKIFNFIISCVVIAHHSVHTPHISKTNLPIPSLNVHESPLHGGWKAKTPPPPAHPQNLKIY